MQLLTLLFVAIFKVPCNILNPKPKSLVHCQTILKREKTCILLEKSIPTKQRTPYFTTLNSTSTWGLLKMVLSGFEDKEIILKMGQKYLSLHTSLMSLLSSLSINHPSVKLCLSFGWPLRKNFTGIDSGWNIN